jgi:hypothetical protein
VVDRPGTRHGGLARRRRHAAAVQPHGMARGHRAAVDESRRNGRRNGDLRGLRRTPETAQPAPDTDHRPPRRQTSVRAITRAGHGARATHAAMGKHATPATAAAVAGARRLCGSHRLGADRSAGMG